jgi:predicted RNA-binding Zn ribbon-like protein
VIAFDWLQYSANQSNLYSGFAREVPSMPTTTTYNAPDVRLVSEFLNTLDVDEGVDELCSADQLATWLRARGLLGPGEGADDGDLAMARDLRAALRAELRTHAGAPADPGGRRVLDELAARMPLRVTFAAGPAPALAAVDGGARSGLSAVLAAVVALAGTGAWRRLKICPADDCAWVFYDESRNRSRRWCSMDVCGNRSKLRAYRTRHGGTGGGSSPSGA